MKISYFKTIYESTPEKEIGLLEFINSVKIGTWKSKVNPIKQEKDKAKRAELKKSLPYVTISGTFTKRKKDQLEKHSGYICLDIDEVENTEKALAIVSADRFTFAAFRSASGGGLAVLVKINPAKHLESFLALERYYIENYQLILDKSCKDITRPRFVSFDPETYINEQAEKWSDTVLRKDTIKKVPNIITGKSDIDYLIEQVNNARVDLTKSSYHTWLEIGFSLASEYGEGGRQYYHALSYFSDKYNAKRCDNQYNHCLKSDGQGITIATLFYYAKEANLDLVSPQTKHIVAVAKQGKRGARTSEDVIKLLETVDGIKKNDSKEIVDKVFNAKGDLALTEELSKLEQIELFIRNNYNLKRNVITRYIENNGDEVDTVFINSVWLQARRVVWDKVPFDTIDKLIGSDFTPQYNPLKDYLINNSHIKPQGLIEKLAATIETDTGLKPGDVDPSYKYDFIKKWLVGVVASIMGEHSPLLLVLTGGQNTGKTEFFRRLLPSELSLYYAESKLDAGKDDEILMTQKIIILDDELGGKSKQEAKRLKELTSKEYFTLREPYGRKNVRLKRLAVLCGTSNDDQVLNDPTGNRRIIPINVISINHGLYNSIDKKELLLEAYHEYLNGYNWRLDKNDVEKLNRNTFEFEQIRSESELIQMFFKTPEYAGFSEITEYLTATEIKDRIESNCNQKLFPFKLALELKTLGFKMINRTVNGSVKKLYPVVFISNPTNKDDNFTLDQDENIETAF